MNSPNKLRNMAERLGESSVFRSLISKRVVVSTAVILCVLFSDSPGSCFAIVG